MRIRVWKGWFAQSKNIHPHMALRLPGMPPTPLCSRRRAELCHNPPDKPDLCGFSLAGYGSRAMYRQGINSSNVSLPHSSSPRR